MPIHAFVWEPVFNSFDYTSRSGISGCAVILCLTFRRATKLFSIAAEPFYTPASNILGFHIFADTSFLLFNSQLCKYKVVFHCGFDLHFPND